MIIGIDARFALKSRRGIGNYSLQLIKCLAEIDKQNLYILYTNEPDEKGILPSQDNFKIKCISVPSFLLWEQVALPYQAKKDKLDLLHCLANTGPVWLSSKIKFVITLHDVMFLKDTVNVSGLYYLLGSFYRRFIVKRIINKVRQIITVSEFSKQDIGDELDVPDSKIKVLWESYNEERKDEPKLSPIQQGRYILCLGANDPRKNTVMIIKIFSELVKNNEIDNLVIVGFKNWTNSKAHKMAINEGVTDKVIFKDYITDEELTNYYQFASMFLYVSLYEGFGIPPLDAMACNCPVVASNVTSIPEIVGDAALIVSPYSQSEIYNACQNIINDDFLRNTLIKKGTKRVEMFSWKKMSADTLKIYQKILN